MINKIKSAGIWATDYDKTIDFYKKKLGFEVKADNKQDDGFFWLEIAPKDSPSTVISICSPQKNSGEKPGGFSKIIFETDDIKSTVENLKSKGVNFVQDVKKQEWGEDYYALLADTEGNTFLLTEEAK
jgi:lactoylglutathione lyase